VPLARPRWDSELASAAKLRNVDHPPAAVAGDVDVEVGHWSLSDEAVEVFTHEHEIGNAPVQRSSGHDAIVAAAVDASLWLGKPARPAPARGHRRGPVWGGRFFTFEQRCRLMQPSAHGH
jgi:hypothetical protein